MSSRSKKGPKPKVLNAARAKSQAVKNTMILVEYVLQSKHGFSKNDILEFLSNMSYTAEAINEGRLNLKDIEKANKEEVEVTLYSSNLGEQVED